MKAKPVIPNEPGGFGILADFYEQEQYMNHEPGRERHVTHKCEKCRCIAREDELTLTDEDEYWCGACIDNANEAAYERQQERDLESPPESAREEQLRTWEEKQKAHKR